MRRALAAVLVGVLLFVSGCAGSRLAKEREARSSGGGAGGMIAQLNFPAEVDASVGGLVNYNPYSPKPLTGNWLYEPLMFQNSLDCEVTPWLATDHRWEGATKLTFTIRRGVKWSDGTDFTARDVAFTYNVMKTYPAMDKAGVWTETYGAKAESVTAVGNSVVFQFTGDAVSKFGPIIAQKILPEKQYGSVGDPTRYIDKDPVSIGPFVVGNYNGRRLELVRRPEYWQADKIKVEKLVLEGNYDANQAVLKLRSGGLDFYNGELPNPQKSFVDADPELNHFWYAPNGITTLAPNLTKPPFDDVKFREALAYGMNRKNATLKATYGIMATASQSGLVLPQRENLLPAQYPAASTEIPYDPAKANQLLDAAGYTKGSDGKRRLKDGSPLSIVFSVQAGFIDYEAMADEFVNNFRGLGLDIKANKAPPEAVDQQKKNGNFQLMIGFMGSGCDYVVGMGGSLSTDRIPTKTEVRDNVGRFSDPRVDETVRALTGATDEEQIKALVGVLVEVMMTQYPVLPISYAPVRSIYRTERAVGWPDADDPYTNPDSTLVTMSRLQAPS